MAVLIVLCLAALQVPAADQALIRDAEAALGFSPVSVMDKAITPPGGDKHDYMSQAHAHACLDTRGCGRPSIVDARIPHVADRESPRPGGVEERQQPRDVVRRGGCGSGALTPEYQPILREGTPLGRVPRYAQVKHGVFEKNTFMNCGEQPIVIGSSLKAGWPQAQRILMPEENRVEKNAILPAPPPDPPKPLGPADVGPPWRQP